MRPVLPGDAIDAARVLLGCPREGRAARMARLLEETQAADAYRKRFGRVHPRWGNGSLMGRARMGPLPAMPGLDDADFARCLVAVFAGLVAWREVREARGRVTGARAPARGVRGGDGRGGRLSPDG